jgi:hypothetical protein
VAIAQPEKVEQIPLLDDRVEKLAKKNEASGDDPGQAGRGCEPSTPRRGWPLAQRRVSTALTIQYTAREVTERRQPGARHEKCGTESEREAPLTKTPSTSSGGAHSKSLR